MKAGVNFGPENLPSGPITNSISCSWIVFGTEKYQVRFKYFDIPSNNQCWSNHADVYDGWSSEAPLIEQMCGEKCEDYVVEGTGNILTVTLEVSSPGSFRGFYAQFEEINFD